MPTLTNLIVGRGGKIKETRTSKANVPKRVAMTPTHHLCDEDIQGILDAKLQDQNHLQALQKQVHVNKIHENIAR